MKYGFLLSLFVVFFLVASSVSAQVPIAGGLDLSASIESPAPGQTVKITARSYAIDINSAKISWVVDGTTAKNAIGATTLEIKAPVLGKTISIKVTATNPGGGVEFGTINIGSGSVDFILETDGYTPPFFKGKISPVYQNAVKIIIIPHLASASGQEYDPKNLTYQWKKNDRVIEDQSGYGKQSITLVGDIVPRPYDLSVDVWTRDNSSHTQGFIQIEATSPSINFYADDPLYGPLFNRAISSVVRIGSQRETSVLAIPFGFNKDKSNFGNLSWSWLVNDSVRSELSSKESVVLRAPDDSSGSSNIQLNIVNADKILQGASAVFSALFSAQKDSTATQQGTF